MNSPSDIDRLVAHTRTVDEAQVALYAALAEAQANFEGAMKGKVNPAYRSQYADLQSVVDAVRPALNASGIWLQQDTVQVESGVTIETVFIHKAGGMLRAGRVHVPVSKHDAQGYGSALTYARRYSLQIACGIAPEDDDGNAAAKAPRETAEQKRQREAEAKRRDELDAFANDLLTFDSAGDQLAAIRMWYAEDAWSADPEDKTEEQKYVWGMLRENSKLRAAIKANKPA